MKNFTNILGNAMMGGGVPVDPAIIERQLPQKRSVMDFVRTDLGRLKGMIPSSQGVKLDAHLEGIRLLESTHHQAAAAGDRRLREADAGARAGHRPVRPGERRIHPRRGQRQQPGHHPRRLPVRPHPRGHFTFADGNNDLHPINYVSNPTFKIDGNHHDGVSHGGKENRDSQIAKKETDIFYGNITAKALSDMDKVPEGSPGETLLDNTLTYYFSECSYGDEHEMIDVCTLLFGGKFLKLNVGNYLSTRRRSTQRRLDLAAQRLGQADRQVRRPEVLQGHRPGRRQGADYRNLISSVGWTAAPAGWWRARARSSGATLGWRDPSAGGRRWGPRARCAR